VVYLYIIVLNSYYLDNWMKTNITDLWIIYGR